MVKRTSLNLDLDLVRHAREALGTATTTETVHRALAEVIRRKSLEELAAWRFDHLAPDWLEKLRRPRLAEPDEPETR